MCPSERASHWVISTLPFRIFPTSKFHFPCSLKTPKTVNRAFPPSRRDSLGCPLNKSLNVTPRLHNILPFCGRRNILFYIVHFCCKTLSRHQFLSSTVTIQEFKFVLYSLISIWCPIGTKGSHEVTRKFKSSANFKVERYHRFWFREPPARDLFPSLLTLRYYNWQSRNTLGKMATCARIVISGMGIGNRKGKMLIILVKRTRPGLTY